MASIREEALDRDGDAATGNGGEQEATAKGRGRRAHHAPGGRLAELRREHRYSIRALAARATVSASLISDVERGKVEPSISTLKRLASALGTTLTYFFSEPAAPNGRVVRASERVALSETGTVLEGESRSAIQTGGIRFELASPREADAIEAIFGHYEGGA